MVLIHWVGLCFRGRNMYKSSLSPVAGRLYKHQPTWEKLYRHHLMWHLLSRIANRPIRSCINPHNKKTSPHQDNCCPSVASLARQDSVIRCISKLNILFNYTLNNLDCISEIIKTCHVLNHLKAILPVQQNNCSISFQPEGWQYCTMAR